MKRLLTAAQMRAVDAAAAHHGMPSSVLMENAGAALAQAALRCAAPDGRFVVICGAGNNGGDGLVAARALLGKGRVVLAALVGGQGALEGEPARNLKALEAMGVRVAPEPGAFDARPGDVVVDAVFGTGLSRPPGGAWADAIGRIAAWRQRGAKVVSADLPSGLQTDTGQPYNPCVEADVTVSFGHLKLGQALEPGASLCGAVELADIGIPRAAEDALQGPFAWLVEESDVRDRLPVRRAEAHKGTYGHVLVVAGSWGKSGAAALAGQGALRAGAGLVTVATRADALQPAMAHASELMGLALTEHGPLGPADLDALLEAAAGKQALVIGPGIPRGAQTAELLGELLEQVETTCVLDADALNALAQDLEQLRAAKGKLILTPHPGEMARLTGKTAAEVNQDRVGLARQLAARTGAVVVLKGARTVIADPGGEACVNPTGNPGMATAGSGDVLAGVLGALVGQGLSPLDAAVVGVFAHGLAGDLMAQECGQLGLVASDLLAGLPRVWARLGR